VNRRSFMKAILAAGAAPYVVTSAGVLMPARSLLVPDGNGWIRVVVDVGVGVRDAKWFFSIDGNEWRPADRVGQRVISLDHGVIRISA
jgi:hypothetical protein